MLKFINEGLITLKHNLVKCLFKANSSHVLKRSFFKEIESDYVVCRSHLRGKNM